MNSVYVSLGLCYRKYKEQLSVKQRLYDIKAFHLPIPSTCWLSEIIKGDTVRTVSCSQVCLRRGGCFFLKQRLKAVITGQATWACLNWFWAKNWCFRRNAAKQVFQHCRTWESMQCWGPRLVCRLPGRWMCVASALLTHSPIKYVTVVKGRRIE